MYLVQFVQINIIFAQLKTIKAVNKKNQQMFQKYSDFLKLHSIKGFKRV